MDEHGDLGRSVSVIGLGAMGLSIARTLLEAGYSVSVWNRSREKVDAAVAMGASACDGPADAFKDSTKVVICLTDYAAWHELIEKHGLHTAFDGVCILQLTTGTIEEVRQHAALIHEHGGRIAEGKVQCYPSQLGTSAASLLMAGQPEVLAACEDVCCVLAPEWMNLGDDIGQPAALSRAVVAGFATAMIGFVNGMAIALKAGIPADLFMQHSSTVNGVLMGEQVRAFEAIRDDDTKSTEASLNTWAAAHETIHSVAKSLGTNLVLQDAVQAVFQEAKQVGLGQHDISALVSVFCNEQGDS